MIFMRTGHSEITNASDWVRGPRSTSPRGSTRLHWEVSELIMPYYYNNFVCSRPRDLGRY